MNARWITGSCSLKENIEEVKTFDILVKHNGKYLNFLSGLLLQFFKIFWRTCICLITSSGSQTYTMQTAEIIKSRPSLAHRGSLWPSSSKTSEMQQFPMR